MPIRTRRTSLSLLSFALALSLAPLAQAADAQAPEGPRALPGSLPLLPAPAHLEQLPGTGYTVTASTPLHAQGDAAQRVAGLFATQLKNSGGPALTVSSARGKDGIRLVLDITLKTGTEGYQLRSDARGVTVQAATEAGLFYGAATLSQLLTSGTPGTLPALKIDDAPRFSWRGLMLDSARHFQSLDEIKRVLDAMAEQKLNTFHWHLTDDQGWRMEIKRYPKLTEVGSCRLPAGDGGRDPATGAERPYCGFYTQDQIREVIAYAAARHIQVIPEIDVPGHATAAIAAYPELGTIDTPLKPISEWGVFPNLFNTEESTFEFLENVLEEVIELFPAKYVHVGGDEAVKDQWEASARVQARMKEVGAGNENEMQAHLIKRLEKYLEQHDRRLIGWDEILEGGLPPEATVMSWRGTEGGLKAASEGHDVVMSPVTDMYMDYLQTNSENEPPGRPLSTPLGRVYGFEPVPDALARDKQQHILGLQANMFTEHTRSYARLQHNLFPRLAAVAETGWSPRERRDFADFLARLPTQLQRWQAMGIAYAQTPFEVEADVTDDRKAGTATLALRTPLNYEIRYSVDGSPVTAQSPRYTGPLTQPLPVGVQATTFFDGKALAKAASRFDITATSLLTRNDEHLDLCPAEGKLLLRLEDDGPAEGPRAVFNVNIFNPCWYWQNANVDGIGKVRVRAGNIPYYFQLAHDEPQRRFEKARSAHGEMDILSGQCHGKPLATVPLPAKPGADGFITLEAALPRSLKGTQNLCVRFTGDTRPTMWVLDELTLLPR
ncbi:family 20 glycosylhydrolase [Stenotrophomonas sp.]|uniref:family 20 glycosylhydrolase n=1 Tax=Stenotrophomonas sp. TaxID=69392 RepID=UPI00289A7A90|nr:family 20 glycosylhydrolase [Stenotrophomonas sp.]